MERIIHSGTATAKLRSGTVTVRHPEVENQDDSRIGQFQPERYKLVGFIYKNYLLRSKSAQLPESDRWNVEVTIVRNKDSDGEAKERTFSCDNTFAGKELADMESVIFARKIIDGEIKGLSIDEPNEK